MITLMDKYTIIKLKQKGLSERAIAKKLGINRKTVSNKKGKTKRVFHQTRLRLRRPPRI